jgi:hypothetical protein
MEPGLPSADNYGKAPHDPSDGWVIQPPLAHLVSRKSGPHPHSCWHHASPNTLESQ